MRLLNRFHVVGTSRSTDIVASGACTADRSATLYAQTAVASARRVIGEYSHSFGLATRLLPQRVRSDITSIYALVRVADEIVDGACRTDPDVHLTSLQDEVHRALSCGFSTNLVVHAFALTARRVGFGRELIDPFFDSMRRDITVTSHDEESIARYIYGSAEVVGLMCLKSFVYGTSYRYDELRCGAQHLGAAFQKVNFLRDLTDDGTRLGRSYFPGITPAGMTSASFRRFVRDAQSDFTKGRDSIRNLPPDVRLGIYAATDLYEALLHKLQAADVEQAKAARIRLPAWEKARIVGRRVVTKGPSGYRENS